MAINWNKVIVGGLAGVTVWKAIGPNGQRQVIDALDHLAAEFNRRQQEEERQNALDRIIQSMNNPSVALRPILPHLETPAGPSPAVFPFTAAPVEVDARWREVIVPPAVILILGKKGAGKSALAYRLLELFRYRLTPYVVGAPTLEKRP